MDQTIRIGDSTDRIIKFGIWVEQGIAVFALTQNGKLESPTRKRCGDCHLLIGLSQHLGNRCKLEGFVVWTPVGDDSPEASDRVRIANFISELPNKSLIAEFTHLDQLYHWMSWKNNCISIAKCFLAGHKTPENPLLRALEEAEIDQYYHDQCWLTTDLYENLWKLLSLKEKRIKAAFKKQGWDFSCPRIVLEQILASEINGEFSVILKPHHEENAKELKKIAKLQHRAHKGFGLGTEENKELRRLTQKYSEEPNILLDRLLRVAAALSKQDGFISTRLVVHRALMQGIARLKLDAGCKPQLKQHGQISSTWIDGQKLPGVNHKWKA